MTKKNKHAQALSKLGARKGGLSQSAAKVAAARQNLPQGGRQPGQGPSAIHREIGCWRNAQGRWWTLKRGERFGARQSYGTLDALKAAIDQWLDADALPFCELCGEPAANSSAGELLALSHGMHAHATCLVALRRKTLEKAGLAPRAE